MVNILKNYLIDVKNLIMENNEMNIEFKSRTKIVLSELIRRIIVLIHTVLKLFITIFCIPFMMFSQKHFNCWIDMIKKDIHEE